VASRDDSKKTRPRRRKEKRGWFLCAAVILIAWLGCYFWWSWRAGDSTGRIAELKPPPPAPPRVAPSNPPPVLTNTLRPPAAPVRSNPPPPVVVVIVSNPPPAPPPAPSANTNEAKPPESPVTPLVVPSEHPVYDMVQAQLALARLGISSGSIDGIIGSQTRAALRAFQRSKRLAPTGALDDATRSALVISEPVYTNYIVTGDDLSHLQPLAQDWVGKSEQSSLAYESVLELVAERSWSHPSFIRELNPGAVWTGVAAGANFKVPNVERPPGRQLAAFLQISLSDRALEAFDDATNLLLHFPCSIAQRVEKRPVGELHVAKLAPNPTYLFDPENFPESAEAQRIGGKLVLPAGPNNPVGTAWIGLDKPGYGIHGTPKPEEVGRTESHGCFRLANWNAELLMRYVTVGTPVRVVP
jgi:hypothetical protein